ncbi:VCBS repeat-containing protein [Streptomyces sp. KM273126]|uniref:FG-GAP and VCBS repeat-containing protein n=1 Tax=Streptomyces sp. KM273126 TaxID=2545247 RepID=UPI0014055473|nr:FG-GAP and VCBS repeat-containing protein [Streptomyces sp. KM273126]MBA2809052.1 VCBS repeat-containing protein [Streptomyces sp. KM273126]
MPVRTLAIAVAVSAGLSLTFVPTASAVTAATADDFNGDGVADLVVATPQATVDGSPGAGSVTVLYGSSDGVSPVRSVTITQNSAGVPSAAEDNDLFGSAYATGDLDADGYTDLVVGSPGERMDYNSGSFGSLTVLWGGADGLLTSGGIEIDSPLADSPWEAEKDFGKKIAVGDFDGDGTVQLAALSRNKLWVYDDLAGRTAPTDAKYAEYFSAYIEPRALTAGDFTGIGRAQLAVTGPMACDGLTDCQHSGLYTWGADRLDRASLADPSDGAPGENEAPTVAAATGDIDHDGYTDLVTGHIPASATTVGEYSDAAGFLHIRYGSADGLGAHRTSTLDQDTSGVPGTNEPGDNFGASLAVGDVTGDGYADVVAGVPGKTVNGATQAGAVVLLKGTVDGLTGTDAQAFNQATSGVPGPAEENDWFGSAVRIADIDGNGADIAIAAKGEDVFPGSTRDGADWVLRGSATGPTTSGVTSFSEKSFGFTYPNAEFGSVLGS